VRGTCAWGLSVGKCQCKGRVTVRDKVKVGLRVSVRVRGKAIESQESGFWFPVVWVQGW
jgi:hypothetical protein